MSQLLLALKDKEFVSMRLSVGGVSPGRSLKAGVDSSNHGERGPVSLEAEE